MTNGQDPTDVDPCWLVQKFSGAVTFRKSGLFEAGKLKMKVAGIYKAKCVCQSKWDDTDGKPEANGKDGKAKGEFVEHQEGTPGYPGELRITWIKKERAGQCKPTTYESSGTGCGGEVGPVGIEFEVTVDSELMDGLPSDGDCSSECDTDKNGEVSDDTTVDWGAVGGGAIGGILGWVAAAGLGPGGIVLMAVIGWWVGGDDDDTEADCMAQCMIRAIQTALNVPSKAKEIYDAIMTDIENMTAKALDEYMEGGDWEGGVREEMKKLECVKRLDLVVDNYVDTAIAQLIRRMTDGSGMDPQNTTKKERKRLKAQYAYYRKHGTLPPEDIPVHKRR